MARPSARRPSAKPKTISVPDRYTQPFFSYDGTTSAAVTLTATFGALTATATVTPSAPAARTAGANPHMYTLASSVPRPFDPIFDSAGNLWATRVGRRDRAARSDDAPGHRDLCDPGRQPLLP